VSPTLPPTRIARRARRAIAGAALVVAAVPAPGRAQSEPARPTMASVYDDQARLRALRTVARADTLLRAGRVAAAEALYYDAARRRPRDPAPRLALGRYLASRGATRIGIVLIEEARRFGAPPTLAGLHLAPLYTRVGAWRALAELPPSALGEGARARAAWLSDRTSAVEGPDTVQVPLVRTGSAGSLGAVVLRFGGDSVIAEIDPERDGIVLDRSRMSGTTGALRRFPEVARPGLDPRAVVGVVERLGLGAYTFTNVPVSFATLGGAAQARIGLDVLAPLAPTVHGRTLTLRRTGRVSASGTRHPLLLEPTVGARVGRLNRLEAFDERLLAELREARWTIDPRMGELVVERP